MQYVLINVKCSIPEQWVNHFCSFLKEMERNGNNGHSAVIGFYCDGDGTFRPKFEIDTRFRVVEGYNQSKPIYVEKSI